MSEKKQRITITIESNLMTGDEVTLTVEGDPPFDANKYDPNRFVSAAEIMAWEMLKAATIQRAATPGPRKTPETSGKEGQL